MTPHELNPWGDCGTAQLFYEVRKGKPGFFSLGAVTSLIAVMNTTYPVFVDYR